MTVLVEIVYPANRIVLDYGGLDDLILLGAVDIATGRTFGPGPCRDGPGR
jgi:putative RNA ligase